MDVVKGLRFRIKKVSAKLRAQCTARQHVNKLILTCTFKLMNLILGRLTKTVDLKDAVFTEWKSGGTEKVGWGLKANHGGGYSYRLCPVGEGGPGDVTEDCFQVR